MKKGEMTKTMVILCGLTAVIFMIDAIVHFAVGEGFTVVNLLNIACTLIWIVATVVNFNKWKNGGKEK